MTSTPERRKHSACLLRIRESCPFRKLRKIKCSVSSSSEGAGRQWGACQANCAKTYPQALSVQPFYHQLQQQGDHYSAMEAEAASSIAGPPFSSFPAGTYTEPVSSSSNLMRLRQSSLSTSDPSMELDSGVDPETGESSRINS